MEKWGLLFRKTHILTGMRRTETFHYCCKSCFLFTHSGQLTEKHEAVMLTTDMSLLAKTLCRVTSNLVVWKSDGFKEVDPQELAWWPLPYIIHQQDTIDSKKHSWCFCWPNVSTGYNISSTFKSSWMFSCSSVAKTYYCLSSDPDRLRITPWLTCAGVTQADSRRFLVPNGRTQSWKFLHHHALLQMGALKHLACSFIRFLRKRRRRRRHKEHRRPTRETQEQLSTRVLLCLSRTGIIQLERKQCISAERLKEQPLTFIQVSALLLVHFPLW